MIDPLIDEIDALDLEWCARSPNFSVTGGNAEAGVRAKPGDTSRRARKIPLSQWVFAYGPTVEDALREVLRLWKEA